MVSQSQKRKHVFFNYGSGKKFGLNLKKIQYPRMSWSLLNLALGRKKDRKNVGNV